MSSALLSSPSLGWGGVGGLLCLKHKHMFPSAGGMEIPARGEVWVLEGCISLSCQMGRSYKIFVSVFRPLVLRIRHVWVRNSHGSQWLKESHSEKLMGVRA